MPPTLFPYQLEAIAAILHSHVRQQRVLLSLPTGSGKTLIAATYAKKHFLDHGLRVLWLAHTEELLDQAYECFVNKLGVDPPTSLRLYAGKERPETNPDARLCFMNNLCRTGPTNVDLLVVDEAHRAAADSYAEWLSVYKTYRADGSKVLGLTATPYRLHKGENESLLDFNFSRPPVRVFQKMAYRKSFCELVAIGRVAPFRQVRIESHLSFEMRKENGDFASASLEQLNTPARNRAIVDEWKRQRTKYGKTLIFVGTQNHARTLAKMFGTDGDYAISGDGKDLRREAIEKFRNNEIQVLVNVKILSEGVDFPDVKTVLLARPTMSANLFMQMVGRGSRIAPGKSFFYIVDVHDQLPAYEDLLIGVQDLADRDDRQLEVTARKAAAAEKLSESKLGELAQDGAVLLEVAAEAIETITRHFVGWISFSAADGTPKPVGTLLTADEFALLARLAPKADRIPPKMAGELKNLQGSDALRKCRESLEQGLWGRLGRFSELPPDDLEGLQTTAMDALNLSPELTRTERDFCQEIRTAASRWGVREETAGYFVEELLREPSRVAAIIRVEKDNIPSLLALGVAAAPELRKAIQLKRTGTIGFGAVSAVLMALTNAEPQHAANISAIMDAISKHAAVEDYCLFREGTAQPVSRRRAA